MRDLLIILLVFGSLPIIVARPWVGVLVWSWLGYMNPHRLTWGFAYDFPFAQVVALVTLAAMVMSQEKKELPWARLLLVWLLFVVWMNVSTVFALHPEDAALEWDRTMKIQLISLVTMLLIKGRKRIEALVWTIALSLGFFGIKGGIFAVMTGGNYIVWGPAGSFIEGNNALGLAMVMTMPLIWYLYMRQQRRWLRWGMLGAMALTSLAILSTQSRGAFLAILAMAFFLWLKTPKKLLTGTMLVVGLGVMFANMPTHWHERMASIKTYEEDGSAMGRINAWYFAWNLASDRPLVGGGYNTFSRELFYQYAPEPEDFHDAHSIYFEVLAEHGFVGLALFLALGIAAFGTGRSIIRRARGDPELLWLHDLAAMIQVSLVGYAVGGAFLGLAYFDLYYQLLALLALLSFELRQLQTSKSAPARVRGTQAPAQPDSKRPLIARKLPAR